LSYLERSDIYALKSVHATTLSEELTPAALVVVDSKVNHFQCLADWLK
jgi:hypothetical protein